MAHKNVLVIGNGFDLDLGRKTRYSDFANSTFWPIKVKEEIKSNLFKYLYDYTEKHRTNLGKINWIDIEQALADYLDTVLKSSELSEIKKMAVWDKADFELLKSRFADYLYNQRNESHLNPYTQVSVKVIRAIADNEYFDSIYNFNYTDLETVAKFYTKKDIKCNHIHGNLEDRNIILGINERPNIPKEYRFLFKSRDPGYRSNNLINDLIDAEECVFFGMSFGAIDNIYFVEFLKSIANDVSTNIKKKKHVTIFTYDENSRLSIMDNLYDMGLVNQTLMTHADLTYIRTLNLNMSETKDVNSMNEFVGRLKSKSKEAIRLSLSML